jgi:hypothetical protein
MPRLVEQLVDLRRDLRAAAVEHQRQRDVLFSRQRGDQVERLEDQADLPPTEERELLVVE